MDIFSWFLVIHLTNTDELLLKEMPSKQECVKQQKLFKKKINKKYNEIESISCEEGTVMNTISIEDQQQDEFL